MSDFTWYCFDRTNLPEALFSVGSLKSLSGMQQDNLKGTQELTFGYINPPSEQGYNSPALLVLQDSKAAEVLAWISTYAPESFPLSQFARLINFSDYELIRNKKTDARIFWPRPDRWPSVVLGEILAQGDSDVSIGGLPLSRAQAAFTTPIAKSAIFHVNDGVVETCIERLRVLENDKEFVDRSVSIDELLPIWKKVGIFWDESYPIIKFIELLSWPDSNKDLFDSGVDLKQYPDLLSDSAERRVLAFRKLLKDLPNELLVDRFNPAVAATLATAAFLVGRSTSHVFLLKEISKNVPTVFVWFGLIAGLMGPTFWDVHWSRAVKGIEKGLHVKFDWVDSSQADLSWAEYFWLSRASKNKDAFIDLPKLLPRVLSLEVVPGAVCQLRLKGNFLAASNSQSQEEMRSKMQVTQLKEFENALIEFIGLADRAKDRLGLVGSRKTVNYNSEVGEIEKNSKGIKKSKRPSNSSRRND